MLKLSGKQTNSDSPQSWSVRTEVYKAMATDILAGAGFDLMGNMPYTMKSRPEMLSLQELIHPHCMSLSTNSHFGSSSNEDFNMSPNGSIGSIGHQYDCMQIDSSQAISHFRNKGRVVGRKRPKDDESEERKERQAAKNRQTAKAFRNKMDGMKAYAEMRVNSLKLWVKGLMEIVISQGQLATEANSLRTVRRTHSAPSGSMSLFENMSLGNR